MKIIKNNTVLFIAVSFFLFFVLLLCAPTFVSTDLGSKAAFYLLNKKYSGKIQAEQLSLSWFGKQKIRGTKWINQKEGLFFHCEEISTSSPLWKLFFNHSLGELKMVSPHLEVDVHFSHTLPAAASKKRDELYCGFIPQFSNHKPFFGKISLDQGTLLIFSKNKLLASFQKVVSHVYLPEDKFPIQVALIGQTEQDNEMGKFDIKAEISSLDFDQPNLEVQAKLFHFPIFGIDQLLSFFDPSLKGLLVEGIGPSFDLDLDAKFQPQAQELSLLAQSSLIHAEVQAESYNGRLVLKNPAKISFSLTPALFQRFEALKNFTLKNSPEMAIYLEKLSLPYGFHIGNASLQSQVKISPISLIANETNESINVDAFSFSLASSQIEKELNIISTNSLKMGNLNSQISLKADLQDPFSKTIKGNCKLQIQEFPLKIAELILNEKITPYFGNSFEGQCVLNIQPEFASLTLKAATPLLKISEMQFRIDDKVTLLQPILADYHSSPRLAPIQLSVDQCVFPRHKWEQILFNCHFQIPAIHNWMVDQLQGQIHLNSLENISANIAGHDIQMKCLLALKNGIKEIQLKEPLSLDYVLTPAKFQNFFPKDAKTPLLLAPAALHLSLEPFSIPLTASNLNTLVTKASASIDALSLQYEQQMHTFKNLQFQMVIDAPNETLEAYLKTEGQLLELKALASSMKIGRNLDFSKANLNLSIKTEEFPLSLLDGIIGHSNPLTTFLGPSLNLSLQAENSLNTQAITIAANGKLFNLESTFSIKEGLLELKKPATLDWILNEKGYALLDQWTTKEKEAPFELHKPAHFHISFPNLKCAIKDLDLSKISLSSLVTTDRCSFVEKKTGRLIVLDNFKLLIERANPSSPISFDLQGAINKEGKLALKGELTDLNSYTVKVNGQIQKLPTILLDIGARPLGRVDFPFHTFFGDTLNAQILTELNNFTGPIHLNIHSPNVRTNLNGAFENGVLTLNESLHAQILLTHKFSTLFLKEINPLLITSIESLHPVTLQIESKGFSLPCSQDWSKLSIPSAHIELGQIFCKNEGNLNLALGLLKQSQEQNADLSLWFTPIDLHIQNQECSIERTEIQINNSLEVCLFGDIDLAKERVSMILGLTSQCLHKAFGIENLPPDYVLQVPLKGSLDNVKLDTKKATAKITTLLLWQKSGLASGEVGGSAGALIGELIGKLATLPDRDTPSPAAKQPFPWDKNKPAKVKQPKTKKKSKFKKNEKPLKQLLKILT